MLHTLSWFYRLCFGIRTWKTILKVRILLLELQWKSYFSWKYFLYEDSWEKFLYHLSIINTYIFSSWFQLFSLLNTTVYIYNWLPLSFSTGLKKVYSLLRFHCLQLKSCHGTHFVSAFILILCDMSACVCSLCPFCLPQMLEILLHFICILFTLSTFVNVLSSRFFS